MSETTASFMYDARFEVGPDAYMSGMWGSTGELLKESEVTTCPVHGLDHLSRDPSCESCKKALGPM